MLNECKGMRGARTGGFMIILEDQAFTCGSSSSSVDNDRHFKEKLEPPYISIALKSGVKQF